MIYGMPERLKKLRWEKGYTQQMVADRVCISQSEISKYESGDKTPGVQRLLQISVVYRCSLDYLVGKDTRRNPGDEDEDGFSKIKITKK